VSTSSSESYLSLALAPSKLTPLTIRPRTRSLPGSTLRLLVALLPTLRSATLSRRDLVVESLALRQQPVTRAGRRRPDIRPADRLGLDPAQWPASLSRNGHKERLTAFGRSCTSGEVPLALPTALSLSPDPDAANGSVEASTSRATPHQRVAAANAVRHTSDCMNRTSNRGWHRPRSAVGFRPAACHSLPSHLLFRCYFEWGPEGHRGEWRGIGDLLLLAGTTVFPEIAA
jgi:hypothetical protein